MKKIILIGGGGHAKSCIDVIEREGKFGIAGIIDLPEKLGQKTLGYEVIGCDENIPDFVGEDTYFLITIGQIKSARKRAKMYAHLKTIGANIATCVSPRAYVSRHARIEEGCVVMHGAVINADAQVGANCIINSCALIEHDAQVGANCHISTASILNGGVWVGAESFVGSAAVVINGANVPAGSFIKAGTRFV